MCVCVCVCVCAHNCWYTRWRSWLRHCATSRKVTGSIPVGVVGIFQWLNPFDRVVVSGSTQALTETTIRDFL
jgi:hypothetical protein